MSRRASSLLPLLGFSSPLLAHGAGDGPGDADTACLVAGLALVFAGYAIGALRLMQRRERSVTTTLRMAAWLGGWAMLVVCLLSPLDTAGARSFAVHMTQHELLMLVAAPLLVASHPLPVFLWALPTGLRKRLGSFARSPGIRRAWSASTGAAAGWTLHAVALWAWHVPTVFQAALRSRGLHDLQHATFLITALLFWSGMLTARAANRGAAAAYLFTTTLHTGALGALITFAAVPWYEPPLRAATGFDALADQQLGGLLMWIPGSFVYVAMGLVMLARWVRDADRTPGRV